ncbi:HPr family phosphocarrier protein, partial [Acidobacteria bacterium AH-259-G07]|nr:HPr family phosphocarrier protein [Acidobacteria bacterium AH-259-G07]
MIRRTLYIKNELGLHARAAAKLVRLTSQFESDIKLATPDNGRQVDGKSI